MTSETTDGMAIDLDGLQDALENNSRSVHSYLNRRTGRVVRMVDGSSDLAAHARIQSDPTYLPIPPVSPRVQHEWLEAFTGTVADLELRAELSLAISGPGAFKRFKQVLTFHSAELTRWWKLRRDRLRRVMDEWLAIQGLTPQAGSVSEPREALAVPAEPRPGPHEPSAAGRASSSFEERLALRRRRMQLDEIARTFGTRELDALIRLGEFLRTGRANLDRLEEFSSF